MSRYRWMVGGLALWAGAALAQMPMIGGMMPGLLQMQAIEVQRHQARTRLYQEALEEIRKNPAITDIRRCVPGEAGAVCLPEAADTAQVAAGTPVVRRHFALLIGNNAYGMPIPALSTPIHDVEQIGQLLTGRFGFQVRVVRDAGKADIVRALNAIAAEARPEDSVLIMYAGHGYLMDDTDMGYWIPVDASVSTAANWIANRDIAAFLKAIPARQIMLVSDSCFSGTLAREQKLATGATLGRDDILRRRAVLVFSSGGEEPVSDEGKEGHSIFAWSLIEAIRGMDRSAPGFDVYRRVKDRVVREYPQEPQYGAVLSAGHSAGGDFLLEPAAP